MALLVVAEWHTEPSGDIWWRAGERSRAIQTRSGKERAVANVFARKSKASGANENEEGPTDTGTFAKTNYTNIAQET